MIESIAVFLADYPWWVAFAIFLLQIVVAVGFTGKNLRKVNRIFSEDDRYEAQGTPLCISVVQGSKELKPLVEELNDYLKKNNGTADYSIIQNKTERFVNCQFEKAVARISFPTYIGLMGTFLGVMIGLGCFNATGGSEAGLVNDERISFLIHGVLISMSTSFIGLLITTVSSHCAAIVKSTVDERKGRFYEFIQNELIPELGTSIVSSLHKLRSTINRFEPAFNKVIDRFQETFDTCTSSFGEAFRQNVTVVANAVDTMGKNMAVVNESIQKQQRILEELQSKQTQVMLRKFVEAANSFDRVGETMNRWEETAHSVMISSGQLVVAQTKYNESLELPQAVANRLQSLLDRFTQFEQSINKLGELDAFKGSQLQMIEKQLEIIHRRSAAVEDFTNEEKERMEDLLSLYSEGMRELQGKLQRAMDDQAETIEQAHSEYQQALKSKCNSFLNALDEAFSSEEMAVNFRHLENLVSIDRHLSNLTAIEEQLRQLQETIEQKEDTTEAIRHLERTWQETAAVLVSNRKSYSTSNETRHETVRSAEKHGRKGKNWWNKIVFWK